MKIELNEMPCFGVAGNFTGHLEQAGEAVDFANVVTKEANAPKAMFPTYIPGNSTEVPEFLHTFPFECGKIIFPANEQKLQIEPECAIICCLEWDGENVVSVKPVAFGASNDCSIRKEGAKKISLKKNWGKASKGLSENLIAVDRFTAGGILDSYRIASFLVRDGIANVYGEDSPVSGYSYIYEKLIESTMSDSTVKILPQIRSYVKLAQHRVKDESQRESLENKLKQMKLDIERQLLGH